ncbi:MAG: SAM-dependent methyltransferase [Planctomycetaceae bacterium]|nr:SAM-dependent methyltransferase [Planctomycetaceae bacterium]|tara:strand:+ start:1694 stop:2770 length:1077 start_codon:yes stop_codon:yes gene_type:complete
MSDNTQFIYCCCQYGAQTVLKKEILESWPQFKFSFSRPGFVTFKIPATFPQKSLPTLDLKSTFARCYGISLGSVKADGEVEKIQFIKKLTEQIQLGKIEHLHVWKRDISIPGNRGFEPGRDAETDQLAERIATFLHPDKLQINRIAKPDQRILDIIIIDQNHWWVGWHQATKTFTRWPGGVYSIRLPEHIVSRAYRKMEEAIRWSRLPLKPRDLVAEIGSSPGGGCQALLARNLQVIGIDPAGMHETLLQNPDFTHIRKKAAAIKRSDFVDVRWLMSDSNVAPNYTLDSVEHIVNNKNTNIRGMLLTLKMIKWELAAELPTYLDRIRSWGYQYIRSRQLAFNRQEICIAVQRSRGKRR